MKFAVIGASGMAGHTIALYLKEQGEDVVTITRKPLNLDGIRNIIGDAIDRSVLYALANCDVDVVVNCVGLLNDYANNNPDKALMVNEVFPHELARLGEEKGFKLIHLSTDCVFSGKAGSYTESSIKDGESVYDRTKANGEVTTGRHLTFRNSIIGPDMNANGIGLLNWALSKKGETVFGYTNVYWNGITTLQLAKAVLQASKEDLTGLYQVTSERIAKCDLLRKIGAICMDGGFTVVPKEVPNRVDKTLVNTRKDFDHEVPDYDTMIAEAWEFAKKHKELYKHYRFGG